MQRAEQATNEEAKLELLQLATAWMELEQEVGRKPDAALPQSGTQRQAMLRTKECLAHAEMCRALAARSSHLRRKAKLLELAAKWLAIADKAVQS